ncbi:MAG: mechanosensitive ion channel family protein [Bacteroidaceae bacterium]|nr:mechanosensitive ion channel family protein [Bacteroidaceae bacterium]
MESLNHWMNDLLQSLGVSAETASLMDDYCMALMIVLIALALNYILQEIVVVSVSRYLKKKPIPFLRHLLDHKVLSHVLHLFPGVLMQLGLPLAFVEHAEALAFCQKLVFVYMIGTVMVTINSLLKAFNDWYDETYLKKGRPIKSLVQVLQVVMFFIGGILVVSVLIDKSPASLFAGLGASAAVLMLVFKDSILGFVAGVQLSANDMLRVGDWIQLSNGAANGVVTEITLNTVKIQNWDKTITTIPPYTLVNTTFQNWRGMQESGGRRVNKLVHLDLNTLKFCTPEFLEKIKKEIPLMADYQYAEKDKVTNAQLFRVYVWRYLQASAEVNQDMDVIVSQKEATQFGLPIQIYFFLRNKVWREYESIQSDIFDHFLVMVQAFDLKLYQYH